MSASSVKGALTVENDAYAAFTRRVLAAHGRRVAAGDVEGLAALAALAADVDRATGAAVAGLRCAGYAWSEIADRLGVTRQAAQQRFGAMRGVPGDSA